MRNKTSEICIDSVEAMMDIINSLSNNTKYVGIIDVPYTENLYIKAERLRFHKYTNCSNICWFTPGYIRVYKNDQPYQRIGKGNEEPLWYFSNNIYEDIIDYLELEEYGKSGIYIYSLYEQSKPSIFIPINYQWQIDVPIANNNLYKESVEVIASNIKKEWKKYAKQHDINKVDIENTFDINLKFLSFHSKWVN